ncbi:MULTISPECIES: hypothetical protein [Pseudoalteromonas]|uniref:hypothetical protein n=1 Tax=Pseudoalteromonas TaxID=53246 RepID=UPI001583D7E9|nr:MULTISPECIES: hypothetical protein [Pseudoalteromonas]MDI4654295.1 hypothetical protein [Pseudoalteromonas shioyasakiensis]NUJ40641.1 hypothetical protein [Pseudoalteromonas sp. 0303]
MAITSIKSISSKQDLEKALKRADELWDVAEPNTPKGEELVMLTQLIEDYELAIIVSQRVDQEVIVSYSFIYCIYKVFGV